MHINLSKIAILNASKYYNKLRDNGRFLFAYKYIQGNALLRILSKQQKITYLSSANKTTAKTNFFCWKFSLPYETITITYMYMQIIQMISIEGLNTGKCGIFFVVVALRSIYLITLLSIKMTTNVFIHCASHF